MNGNSEGLPIALTGKVKVRIIGDIQKGDCIVPSDILGCAEKGEFYDEMKFGYALESKTEESDNLIMCIIK